MWPWSSAHCIVDVLDKQFSTVHNLPFWIQDFFGKTFAKKKSTTLIPINLKTTTLSWTSPFSPTCWKKLSFSNYQNISTRTNSCTLFSLLTITATAWRRHFSMSQWPPRSLWLWQSLSSDLIRSVSCIWHDRPPHSSRSSPKLLWYFWFCSQLISVIPFRLSADHLHKQHSVWPSCPSVWSAWRFSPWAHSVWSIHSTTFSDITKSLYGASVLIADDPAINLTDPLNHLT